MIFNWGFVGCSTILPSFIEGLKTLSNANCYAVASRNLNRAKEFSDKYKISKHYGSYEELVKDKEVDIVYISTTNDLHKENVLLCLNAGKHVLCEKPLTLSYDDTKELVDLAREKNLFFMEGLWTMFLPTFVKLRELIEQKIIGEVKMIRADFGFTNDWGIERRLLNKQLGGGTLMDNGIYPISLPLFIFGIQPDTIQTFCKIGETGVDEYSCYLLSYNSGEVATLSSSIRLSTPQDAIIIGTKGYIVLPDFWHGNKLILYLDNKEKETFNLIYESTGYNYEAKEVMDCIESGKKESEIMNLNKTLEIAKLMNNIREKLNIKFD
ncbi:Gfo/Idh/MocA family oxidoreductase [archaeon]|nr:Gfo/Idh/MocA family oxidoreductase [archaeon]